MASRPLRVAIIGGGAIGTSILFHLAKRHGVTDAVLFERGQLASGSTSYAVGGVRYTFSHPVNIEMGKRNLAFYGRFEEEVGVELEFRRNGYLFVYHSEERERSWRELRDRYRQHGMEPELMTAGETAERFPILDPSAFRGALFAPECGHVDPYTVTRAYASAAIELGGAVKTSTEVTDVLTREGAVHAVETAEGTHEVDYVVCAAGAWSGHVAGMVDLDLPLDLFVRRIVVTSPIDGFVPLVLDQEREFYFEMEQNGSLLVCNTAGDVHGVDDPDAAVGEIGYDYYLGAFEKLEGLAPGLDDLEVINDWSGLQAHTPDGHALVGPTGVDGFLLACGLSGHGVMQSPSVGAAVSDLIAEGETDVFDASTLSPERFDRPPAKAIEPELMP